MCAIGCRAAVSGDPDARAALRLSNYPPAEPGFLVAGPSEGPFSRPMRATATKAEPGNAAENLTISQLPRQSRGEISRLD